MVVGDVDADYAGTREVMMIAEISMTDIVIAFVAVYAAILSTYSIWPKKAQVDVDISIIPLMDRSKKQPYDAVILDATNVGRRTTTLSRAYLLLPSGLEVSLLFDQFPFELKPDTACRAWIDVDSALEAAALSGQHIDEGPVTVKGVFVSTKGARYESSRYELVRHHRN